MPLIDQELTFLDAYVYEVTAGPSFGGPATRLLSQMGIWYSDLSWLLTAYQRQLSAKGEPSTGKANANPPPPPWKDAEEVKQRNKELKAELESPALDARKKTPAGVG